MLSSRSLAITSVIASILLTGCSDDGAMSDGPGGAGSGGWGGQGGSSAGGSGGGGGADAVSFHVTVENVSGSSALPTPFAPGVWALHSGSDPLFSADSADRSEGLVAVAEDGSPAELAANLEADTEINASGVFDTPDGGSKGPAFPGDSYEFDVMASPGDKLSLATMFVHSNDVFLAPTGDGIALFDANGDAMPLRDVTSDFKMWDVGSEKEEAPGMGPNQAPAQSAANTGPAEGVVSKRVDGTRAIPLPAKLVSVTVSESAGTFEIQVTNISRAGGALMTPLAPIFAATHDASWSLFSAGGQASSALESLAESGSPAMLVSDHSAATGIGTVQAAGSAPIGPTQMITFSVTPTASQRYLSFASMLVRTNDVFMATPPAGIALLDDNGKVRPAADVQADIMRELKNWDAGTEANQVPGAGPNQPPSAGGDADPDNTVRPYADRTNDLAGPSVGGFVEVQITHTSGTTFAVTVDNTSDSHAAFGGVITPVAWALHDGNTNIFEMGKPASAGLQALAEDGDPSTFVSELMGMGGVTMAAAEGNGPAHGGAGYSFKVTASKTHRHLAIASMVVPSNDTFFALGAQGVALLDSAGDARSDNDIALDIAAALAAFDAGTELNQAGASGPDMAGPGLQLAGNTGASEGNGKVRQLASPVWGYPMLPNVLRVTIEPN